MNNGREELRASWMVREKEWLVEERVTWRGVANCFRHLLFWALCITFALSYCRLLVVSTSRPTRNNKNYSPTNYSWDALESFEIVDDDDDDCKDKEKDRVTSWHLCHGN